MINWLFSKDEEYLQKKLLSIGTLLLILLTSCSQVTPTTPSINPIEMDQAYTTPSEASLPTVVSEPISTPTEIEVEVTSEISMAHLLGDKSAFGVELHDFDTLEKAVDANIHWLRYNALLWSDYQPNGPDEFIADEELETEMIAVSHAGMELILIVRSTPTWAQKYEGYFCGPMGEEYLDYFASFMGQLVEKYSVEPYNVNFFELWNEPDEARARVYAPDAVLGCWGEVDDPEFGGDYYAEMLKVVYPVIKKANPRAQLVLGGLVLPCEPGGDSYCEMSRFLEGILKVGGGDYFDFVNFHSYTAYDPSQSSVILMEKNEYWWADSGGQVEGRLAYLNKLLETYQVEKPIILTEVALIDPNDAASDDLAAYEQDKAEYLVWLYVRNSARGIKVTNWYHLDRYGWLKGGLLDEANHPLPVYEAYQVLTKALNRTEFKHEIRLAGKTLIFEFSGDGRRVWILFSEDGSPRSINAIGSFITAYDLFGDPVEPSQQGIITFERPIYIELEP